MNAVCVEQSNVRVQCDTTYRQIFNGQNVIFACRRQANEYRVHLHFLHGHVSPGRLSANAGFRIVSSP